MVAGRAEQPGVEEKESAGQGKRGHQVGWYETTCTLVLSRDEAARIFGIPGEVQAMDRDGWEQHKLGNDVPGDTGGGHSVAGRFRPLRPQRLGR